MGVTGDLPLRVLSSSRLQHDQKTAGGDTGRFACGPLGRRRKGIIERVKQLILDLIPAPAPTLDNFVPGRNAEALKALLDVASGAPPARILYLWGESSSGKSHLAQSFSGRLDAAEYFAHHRGILPEAASRFVMDDVHSITEDRQIGVFNLINLINASPVNHVLIATGNAAPRDLTIRRDLASRLGQGLVFQLTPLSDEEKSDALRVHARTRGFGLREEVITYLLRHSRRDMAALVGFLDALDRYSLETGREITLPLLREMVQPQLVGLP